jgi:hypothetical protein
MCRLYAHTAPKGKYHESTQSTQPSRIVPEGEKITRSLSRFSSPRTILPTPRKNLHPQELLGHRACPERSRRDVKTAMIYTHVLQCGWLAVRRPLDNLPHPPRHRVCNLAQMIHRAIFNVGRVQRIQRGSAELVGAALRLRANAGGVQ